MIVDIGIFAYNEAKNIRHLLEVLSKQSLVLSGNFDVKINILANGCTDETVTICRDWIQAYGVPDIAKATVFNLLDFKVGGKSRTWNEFTHSVSRSNAGCLIFIDADIDIPQADTLELMVSELLENPYVSALSSKPVKDIGASQKGLTFIQRLILSAGGTSENWKKSICGQLYIARADSVRSVHMPIGLPVEDGFIRAMILTDLLTVPEQLERIQGVDNIWHRYESISTLQDLIHHQTRIIIGSAINAALFAYIRSKNTNSFDKSKLILADAAKNEDWLGEVIEQMLPASPYGFVPFEFLTKRLKNILKDRLSLKRLLLAVVGFSFDLIVWVLASVKMSRGKGVGFW